MDSFGDESAASFEKALKVVKEFGTMYVRDKVRREDLYTMRDQLLEKAGVAVKSKNKVRMPAADLEAPKPATGSGSCEGDAALIMKKPSAAPAPLNEAAAKPPDEAAMTPTVRTKKKQNARRKNKQKGEAKENDDEGTQCDDSKVVSGIHV